MKNWNYKSQVEFHETDMMGIVHHAQYIKYFEESRVHWLQAMGLEKHHAPFADWYLAVLDVKAQYFKPLRFLDPFSVSVQCVVDGAKILFEYVITNKSDEICCKGSTLHIGVDGKMKTRKPPKELVEFLLD